MATMLSRGTRCISDHTCKQQFPNRKPTFSILLMTALLTFLFTTAAVAQVNGEGKRPYLGWSTYSQQTIVASSTVMNEQNILAQSDAMRASGLGAHGFQYINLDAGWSGDSDPYGRTLWNTTAFPHFLDMIQHIHANGQKIGIYTVSRNWHHDCLRKSAYFWHVVPRAG